MQLETEALVSQPAWTPPSTSRKGLLFVLSAPSGAGKDSVINAALEQGMNFYVVPSVTTRARRPGESEGHPYNFVSQEQFEQMVAHDELIEYAKVHGNWYGQPRKPIRERLSAGQDVLLKIDVQGAASVRKKIPGAIFIFLVPESLEVLASRLIHRNTETAEELAQRLENARAELAEQHRYDYVIVNRQEHLAEAAEQLWAIMEAEHCRVHPRHVEI
ncbi:MAG TPA: guanylate kinase [Ktedonobacteraceae bacterium]|nr:guanylate kinase [Ktedonobacteraceae bacterium]